MVLRGGVRVGAEILAVGPGRSWTWRVRGLQIRHEVEATPRGARLTMTPQGSGPFWAPVALGYRLPTALIARNVARVAPALTGRKALYMSACRPIDVIP